MGEDTKIQWAKHSFNAWIGCTKVGLGCDRCYAEAWDKRLHGGIHWGPGAPRRRTASANWLKPFKWDKAAAALGERHRVFCNSLADVFDNEVDPIWRHDLFRLIQLTPNLDWLLLTKRVGNIAKMLPEDWGDGYPNVWLILTVVNQEEADRDIPKLLRIPARIRGLSMEPLLGPVDLLHVKETSGFTFNSLSRKVGISYRGVGLDWIIVGGESGPGARPFQLSWARSIIDQCRAAGVPVFVKQLGARPVYLPNKRDALITPWPITDRKGGDMSEWPEDLRVREMPT